MGLFDGPQTRANWQAEHQTPISDYITPALRAGPQNRVAPQLDPSQQGQFRIGQMQQVGQLQGIASGQQKGAAELAAERQAQNAFAMQNALAHMRGAGGGGMRVAARNSAGIGINAAGMAQQGAMQDQMGANSLLANVLNQGRGQDIGLAAQNAQLQQQQTGMNDAQYNALMQQLLQQQQLALGYNGQSLDGPMLAAGGHVLGAMMSDERLKTDIAPAGAEIDVMLDALKPYRYKYKDEKHGKGERAGIMAQDLERSEAGRRIVFEATDGKALDVNKALSAALASSARLNERVRKLEASR